MRNILVNKYRFLEGNRWEYWKYELSEPEISLDDKFKEMLIGYKLNSLKECAGHLLKYGLERNFSLILSPKNQNSGLEKGVHVIHNRNCIQVIEPLDEELAEIMRLYFTIKH